MNITWDEKETLQDKQHLPQKPKYASQEQDKKSPTKLELPHPISNPTFNSALILDGNIENLYETRAKL